MVMVMNTWKDVQLITEISPVINAISFILIVSVSIVAVANLYYGKKEEKLAQ
jgi:ABC-type spermidine/putrescine transport system permease subunit II